MNYLAKTFIEFVKIDSPTGTELKFSNYLKKKLARLGFNVIQDQRGNLFLSVRGEGEPILLVAHIDTVNPGCGIIPVLKNGIIKSRGDTILGADNKAVVAIFFEVLRWIQTRKERHRTFEILFSIGEESGISGIDTFDFSQSKARKAICFDMAQPIGTILLNSPYYLRLDMQLLGREADVSALQQGKSTLSALASFLNNFPQGVQEKETLCNIGVIKGGKTRNAVLSALELQGEIRSFNPKKLKSYANKTKKALFSAARFHHCKASYSERLENYGYRFLKTDVLIKEISDCLIRVIPRRSVIYKEEWWGVSDANNINQKGIKTVNLGYGVKNPHTTRENIAVRDMEKIMAFVKIFLSRISTL